MLQSLKHFKLVTRLRALRAANRNSVIPDISALHHTSAFINDIDPRGSINEKAKRNGFFLHESALRKESGAEAVMCNLLAERKSVPQVCAYPSLSLISATAGEPHAIDFSPSLFLPPPPSISLHCWKSSKTVRGRPPHRAAFLSLFRR